MTNLFGIDDRVIVVTGGIGQLGQQFCRALLEHNARVVILDHCCDVNKLDRSLKSACGKRLLLLEADVTERQSLVDALAAVELKWGVPYGLINNAAIDSPPNALASENGKFEDYPVESFNRILDVNVTGVMQVSQVFGARMAQEGMGSIINISSIYGIISPDQRLYEYNREEGNEFYKPISYSVSKSAIVNMTRYLATYWAEKNIRVNTLTFGGVFNNQDQEFLKNYSTRVPLRRMAKEDEYNGAIIFLLSQASSYMTGANMIIDGGFTAW